MWGSSSSDLYVVGSNGNIAHYTNGSWTKIESGSDVRLNDIYGQVNGSKIFTSGYNTFGYQKSSLLQLENNQATIIWNSENNIEIPPYGKQINSISVTFNNLFIASDQGIFKKNIVHNYITPIRLFGSGMKVHKILATGINNIFTVGDQSNIYHYNGLTAHQVYYDYSASNSLYSGTAKESILVGVGTKVSMQFIIKQL